MMAYEHATTSFEGTGAHAVVGPASSGPSMNAQLVLKNFGIPQMSYSASSPDLSDSTEYPTFFRTVASDAFQGKALAQFLANDLSYTNVCVINALDSYSAKGSAAFVSAALDNDMTIVKSVEIPENPSEFDAKSAIQTIGNADCRVVFMMMQAAAAGTVTRHAAMAGMMGPTSTWLWVLADAIAGNMDGVRATAELTTGTAPAVDVDVAFTGAIGSIPLSPSGAKYDSFLALYESQPSTLGTCGTDASLTDSCACDSKTDDFGNKLFQHDHDSDPSTPDKCAGFNYTVTAPNSYSYYAFDAVYALAHAAQKLLDDGAAEFAAAAMIEALKTITFEGVTGTVDFETNGDREVGAGFTIMNHDGTSFSPVGNWDQSAGLTYADGVTLETVTWPTASGDKPSDIPLSTAVLNMGFLHPVYKESLAYDAGGHNRLVGSLLALNEINADPTLLPNTILKFEFMDSKRSSGVALANSYTLAQDAFNGKGADVVVGPASSGPSMNAQLALKNFGIPQMSYSASSPLLSDLAEFPTFFRTCASDAFQGKALAQFLANDLSYTNVCVIKAEDSYSSDGAAAFIVAGGELGIKTVETVQVEENPTVAHAEYAIDMISKAPCRIVFMMTQAAPAGTLIRSAVKAGMMGADTGYLWVLPDAISGNIAAVNATAFAAGKYSKFDQETSLDVIEFVDGVDINAALFGSIGSIPLQPSGPDYDAFLVLYEAQPSTLGTCGPNKELTDSCACDAATDDAGNKLFQHDHDLNSATPDMCAGFDYAVTAPNSYTYYAYDAVYAFAHAAQLMLDKGAEEFAGAAIIEQLKNMTFSGVTGSIDFETNGDREVGAGFTIMNHDGTGYSSIGNWDQATALVYGDGQSVDTIQWSGGVGEANKPVNEVLELCTPDHIRLEVGDCDDGGKRQAVFEYKMKKKDNSCDKEDCELVPTCQDGVPKPTNREVDCHYAPTGSTAGVLCFVLGLLGFGTCVAWGVWVFAFRNNKVIKVAQPMFCASFVVAAALLSISSVVYVGENTELLCMLRPWLFNVFFDIMFGSLFLKTFRVYKIFGNKSLTKVKVSSFDVVKTYGGFLLIDVAILGMGVANDGMTPTERLVEEAGFWSYTTVECGPAETSQDFDWVLLTTFFKLLMVGGGAYLSFVTRKVPDKFAESKWIAVSVYQVAILGAVGLAVQLQNPAPSSMVLVQSICVPLACVATCCCIFGPKVQMIANPDLFDNNLRTSTSTGNHARGNNDSSQGSATSGSIQANAVQPMGGGDDQKDYEEMLIKIGDLEDEVRRLKGVGGDIREAESPLDSA